MERNLSTNIKYFCHFPSFSMKVGWYRFFVSRCDTEYKTNFSFLEYRYAYLSLQASHLTFLPNIRLSRKVISNCSSVLWHLVKITDKQVKNCNLLSTFVHKIMVTRRTQDPGGGEKLWVDSHMVVVSDIGIGPLRPRTKMRLYHGKSWI